MSGFYICFTLSLYRGREWEREVKFCGRINKREIVSKWFLRSWCLVFSRSFVHDCKTAKCFQNQGEQKLGQIQVKSKTGLKFDISRLCSQLFICLNVCPTTVNLCWSNIKIVYYKRALKHFPN